MIKMNEMVLKRKEFKYKIDKAFQAHIFKSLFNIAIFQTNFH